MNLNVRAVPDIINLLTGGFFMSSEKSYEIIKKEDFKQKLYLMADHHKISAYGLRLPPEDDDGGIFTCLYKQHSISVHNLSEYGLDKHKMYTTYGDTCIWLLSDGNYAVSEYAFLRSLSSGQIKILDAAFEAGMYIDQALELCDL